MQIKHEPTSLRMGYRPCVRLINAENLFRKNEQTCLQDFNSQNRPSPFFYTYFLLVFLARSNLEIDTIRLCDVFALCLCVCSLPVSLSLFERLQVDPRAHLHGLNFFFNSANSMWKITQAQTEDTKKNKTEKDKAIAHNKQSQQQATAVTLEN